MRQHVFGQMSADRPARQHHNVTLAVLALSGAAYALLQSLVAPALPDIQHSLHTTEGGVTWVLTSYLVSASVATPILGRLGDIHGKERFMLVSVGLLATGTLLCALAHSLPVMIAGRVVQGAGGGIFPLAFGIIRDEFPRDRVAGGIGLMSAIMAIGAGAGIVLSGVIVDNLDYHFLFWLPLVVIVGATILTWRFVPESPVKAPGSVNWLGATLLSIGLTAVLLAVSRATAWGWGDARLLGLFAAGTAVLVAWVFSELRAREPLVDMRTMRRRGVWTTNVVALLVGFGMYASFILIPQFVEQPHRTGYGFAATVTQAGLYMLPSTMTMLVVGWLAGHLHRRFGSKPPLMAGCGFAGASFVLFAAAHAHPGEVYVASALLGVGIGLAFAALPNLIVEAVPADQTGVATGMNTIMRTIGGALGAVIAATILDSHVSGRTHLPSEAGFTTAFALFALVLAGAIVVSTAIPARGHRGMSPDQPHLEPAQAGRVPSPAHQT